MKSIPALLALALLLSACSKQAANTLEPQEGPATGSWQTDFFDDFDTFNADNWQDQMIWVNDEDQCYVPDNEFNTREVSNGTLKLRVVDLGEKRPCDNMDKAGNQAS